MHVKIALSCVQMMDVLSSRLFHFLFPVMPMNLQLAHFISVTLFLTCMPLEMRRLANVLHPAFLSSVVMFMSEADGAGGGEDGRDQDGGIDMEEGDDGWAEAAQRLDGSAEVRGWEWQAWVKIETTRVLVFWTFGAQKLVLKPVRSIRFLGGYSLGTGSQTGLNRVWTLGTGSQPYFFGWAKMGTGLTWFGCTLCCLLLADHHWSSLLQLVAAYHWWPLTPAIG